MAMFMPTLAQADTATRLSWETFAKDPQRVASLRKAVAVMKSRNGADHTSAEYRTSWEYWGSIHGYFGAQSPDGTVEEYQQWMKDNNLWKPEYEKYFVGVTDRLPPDQTATDVWSQCQHGTPWFFAWHRFYLFRFERVLQEAAGDPSLRLPYWDYTDPAQVAMPSAFIAPTYVDEAGKTVPNPLFEARRAPDWQKGTGTLDPKRTNINAALLNPNFLSTTDQSGATVPGFQSIIERSPHGSVHCAVMGCPVTVMGAVPYSSNDPIFWLHHANIDRMWDCWTSIAGHKNPDSQEFLEQSYTFVDAKGVAVTNKVRDLFDGKLIDYVYEKASDCARPAALFKANAVGVSPAPVVPHGATTSMLISTAARGIAIDKPVTKKHIGLVAEKTNAVPLALALRGHALVPSRTELVLRGVKYQAHPGTMFDVYLENAQGKRAYVGTLSFFTGGGGHGHAHHDAQAATDEVFDVTDSLRELAGANATLKDVSVVFEATTGRLGRDEKALFNAKSKLTVDEIDLQVKVPASTPAE
ncbi:tyrosinase family protein [Andreprevotia chitinilytica]|uniref:tyrosinase family protein n=1 Tax=Andreprevotia chitinilytica TaxID=396808 RepID=UPI0005570158|nr:tyrosinase family protein [Andreprevotia chitinilytica]